jgi:hypothetical protein
MVSRHVITNHSGPFPTTFPGASDGSIPSHKRTPTATGPADAASRTADIDTDPLRPSPGVSSATFRMVLYFS